MGFVIGFICLIAFIAVARRGGRWRRYRHHGFGGGCGDGYGGGYGFHGGSRWGRSRWFIRGVMERLETTPGQEKVIGAAMDDMRAAVFDVRGELGRSRDDLSRVIQSERFDAQSLNETFLRHDEAMGKVRAALVSSLGKVHEALDDRQRKTLANLLGSRLAWL